MKKLNKYLILASLAGIMAVPAGAVPAKPGLLRYDNAGNPISVRLIGDERSHYFVSADGYVLMQTADGEFRYAVPDGKGGYRPSSMKALDAGERDGAAKQLLAGVDRDEMLRLVQAEDAVRRQKAAARHARRRVADESYLNSFPTKGSPKCLAILVEYQDVKFTVDNPRQMFSDMLNKEGFDHQGATGSILDYFKASSDGQFTPQFDVYGPVTLPQNMSYYGGNEGGNDLRPYEMVPHACGLLDDQIDFRDYDNDGDGVIDNVYIFYAGYGEADGGPESSVWPHSWNLNDDLGLEYYFDGKLLNHYATSNELSNGFGSNLAGIGVFCHEFSHVMGLPDLYSTVYTSAFTPGNWSLLDHGSYNNDCHTPPLHTAYERYCLGWIEPRVLDDPCNVTLYPVTQIGNYSDACIIRTEVPTEYYVLENRQQRGWDQYIPGHGMLVWHIDFVPDVWNLNIVNIEKQHIDIVEADNDPSPYTIEGDAFPGSANVTAFTDETVPSMKSWAGKALHAPITEIKEINGVITFMFKGGEDIFDPVKAHEASMVKAGGFTATWAKVTRASGYLLTVYTKGTSGRVDYVPGMMRLEVGDVDSYEVSGLTPSTDYYYVVQATNGRFYSSNSNEVNVKTLDPTLDYLTVEALSASDITADGFTARWNALDLAERYTVALYARQLGEPFLVKTGFDNTLMPDGWKTLACSFDSRAAYCIEAPSLRMTTDGASLTTSEYKDGVRTLSFWLRTNTEPNANYLLIEGLVAGEWVTVEELKALPEEWTQVNIDEFPLGCRAVRMTYVRPESGNLNIDDVVLGYGGDYELLPIAGKTAIEAGNATSLLIDGLEPESEYSYGVTAHNADFSSHESPLVQVRTAKASGIAALPADEAECEYYNLQGIRVMHPQPGEVYIVRRGARTAKIIY